MALNCAPRMNAMAGPIIPIPVIKPGSKQEKKINSSSFSYTEDWRLLTIPDWLCYIQGLFE